MSKPIMEHILNRAFARVIDKGSLHVTFASGRQRTYGDGSEAPISVRFTDAAAQRAIIVDPGLKLGQMYSEGRFIVEEGSIYDLLSLMKRNGIRKFATLSTVILHLLRVVSGYARQSLSPKVSKDNVAHHYDLDERLFRLFLDDDMQYSCAYFESPEQSLEEAQLAKKRHIAAKMLLEPGHKVLDIGSGWGGMGIYLAEIAQANVTGVTLSEEQLRVSRHRAMQKKLSGQLNFELCDYRAVQGCFDRIVSVGMLEHVGRRNYSEFFKTTAKLLNKEGVFVLHSIGRPKPRLSPQPFIDKYIFPGSYVPALSEIIPQAERAGFLIKDVEILPLHYAMTLREWRRRFLAHRDEVLALYDENFLRMWEFYLAACETNFRHDRSFIFQLYHRQLKIRFSYFDDPKIIGHQCA
jgi:cyclopropane-fatty-acyl-phospholipid synthase